MKPSEVVRLMVVISISCSTLCGLFGNRYTNQRTKFVQSNVLLLYRVLVFLAFTFFYGRQIYEDHLQNSINFHDAVQIYSYMSIVASIINYIAQFWLREKTAELLNNIPLFETIDYFDIQHTTVLRGAILTMVRVVVFPILIETALIFHQLHHEPDRNLFYTFYILFPVLLSNLLISCYISGLIITRALLEALNKRLNSLVQEVNCLQTPQEMKLQKQYYRMSRFCELADLLDELSRKYTIVCTNSMEYLVLNETAIVLSLLFNLLGITLCFFNQYQAIADTFINDEPYNYIMVLTNLLFLVCSFMEMRFITNLCNNTLIQSKHTGYLLQSITLKHVDIRFKHAVEEFALQVNTIKYKIAPLGLLQMDVNLVNNIITTVMSFLLILIQSDLTLRFSLK